MNWQEKIMEWNNNEPVTLFATATTGLRPHNSKLLALSYAKVSHGGEIVSNERFIKEIPIMEVMQGQEFHKISPTYMTEKGVPEEVFKEQIKELLTSGCVFSYNPKFQVSFLESDIGDDTPFVHDLLLMLKGAEMRLCLSSKVLIDLHTMEQFFINRLGKAPGLKNMCIGRDLVYDPPLTTLPVDYYVDCLVAFWKMLGEIDVCYQEELF